MAGTLPLSLVVITRNAADAISRPASRRRRSPPRSSSSTRAAATIPWKSRGAAGARVVAGSGSASARRSSSRSRRRRTTGCCASTPTSACRPSSRASIRAALAAARPRRRSTAMARRNRFLGRWLAHGEGYPDWSARLFDRRARAGATTWCTRRSSRDGAGGASTATCCTSRPSRSTTTSRSRTATRRCRREAMHARGERAGLAHLALSPLVRFLEFYVLRLGFLDGAAGFAHISIGCMRSFLKYAKLRALNARASTGDDARARCSVLVTGAAGFIGMHGAAAPARARRRGRRRRQPRSLLRRDAEGGAARAARRPRAASRSSELDLADARRDGAAVRDGRLRRASCTSRRRPGVRYSLVNPAAYLRTNLVAFAHVLEGCRHAQRRAPGLRVELERLRREPQAAVLRGPASTTR